MINSRDLNELHPTLKRGAEELRRKLNLQGYNLGVSATYRDNEYQNSLYQQGRTKSGSIVTNAKGGESIHNYRLAFDIFQNVVRDLYNEKFMQLAGKTWIEMGGEWGGSWTSFPDKPHMQFTGGLTLKDLQNGKKLDNNTKMKWEEEKGEDENMYNKIEEVPSYARETIEKLINKKLINGDDKGNLGLNDSVIKVLVINDRAGLY